MKTEEQADLLKELGASRLHLSDQRVQLIPKQEMCIDRPPGLVGDVLLQQRQEWDQCRDALQWRRSAASAFTDLATTVAKLARDLKLPTAMWIHLP